MQQVSVVVPLYNGAAYIEEALNSILSQTVPMAAIIVVDDGSEDDGCALAEAFSEVTLIRKKHTGIKDTLNYGLSRCSSEFIAFLDADDRWRPEKTELQLHTFEIHPVADMVFGNCQRFRMLHPGRNREEQPLDIVPGFTRCGGLFRNSLFEEVGGFSDDTAAHSFMDWYMKAMELKKQTVVHNDVVFERRIHDRNYSLLSKDLQRQQYFATIRAALERRRER